MLTLTNSLSIEGYTVYRDDASATTFNVLPNTPTIARDANGRPVFSLIVYRRDEERLDVEHLEEDAGGGILTFTVELGIPEATLKKIRGRLRALVYGEGADDTEDVTLDYVSFIDGKVSVAVAGEGSTDTGDEREFVRSMIGTGKVSSIGANRRAVMVKLTQDGASLLSQLEKLSTLPINVQYDLSFEHRLVGVTVEVHCDIVSSYTLVQAVRQERLKTDEGGYLDDEEFVNRDTISEVAETMVRGQTAWVKVIPQTSSIDQDTLLALEKFGMDMLSREIEKAIAATNIKASELNRGTIEEYASSASNALNFTLDRTMVLTRNFNPSANITNVFEHGTEGLVVFVDLRTAFFKFLEVPIRVNADFSRLPLDSVTVTIRYERDRMDGVGREVRVDSFSFTDGSSIQKFVAYANSLDEVSYDWSATVHYKGSQDAYEFSRANVKDNFLVIDVGSLGMLQVDAGVGLVDFDKFPSAHVSLRYRSARLGRVLEQSFVLGKDKQSTLWTELIREDAGAYEFKVDWLRKDGEILPGEWSQSSASRLRLDAPVPDRMSTSIAATGNFKDEISQVVVSLLYRDDSNPHHPYVEEGAFTFTSDNQTQMWNVDLRNNSLRGYRYRYSIIYKDGVVRDVPEGGGWLDGEAGFIVVGEKYGLEVEVHPYLLTFPDHAKICQVDLSYGRGTPFYEISSFVFTKENSTKSLTWRVRTEPGAPKEYDVDVTYISARGVPNRRPTRHLAAEALILEPPPEAA